MKFICFLMAMMVAAAPARAEDITSMISHYRREHGLPAVKTDPTLTAVAERQARAMARTGIMDHDVDGSFTHRIASAHLASGAENIAAGTKTWSETLHLWEQSPGHNRNLLLPGADMLGVAVARNENTPYKVYWAMVIGRKEVKRRPGLVAAASLKGAAARPGRGVDASPDAPAADSSVSEWVNHTITSIKNLLQ